MLNLFILRHADSGWAEPGQKDIERCLSARGINQLDVIADTISNHSYSPMKVICSSATRTRQTLSGIKSSLGKDISIEFEKNMYSGEIETYFDIVTSQSGNEGLMLVGHNPMCAGFCMQLAGDGEEQPLYELALGFPSGTLAHLQFEKKQWQDIKISEGYLKAFHVVR